MLKWRTGDEEANSFDLAVVSMLVEKEEPPMLQNRAPSPKIFHRLTLCLIFVHHVFEHLLTLNLKPLMCAAGVHERVFPCVLSLTHTHTRTHTGTCRPGHTDRGWESERVIEREHIAAEMQQKVFQGDHICIKQELDDEEAWLIYSCICGASDKASRRAACLQTNQLKCVHMSATVFAC
ncbi:hypothetical protein E1301_Tti005920 [Triplophysa tibetana]|uniref:Uncharacterized protein n=1 Tax=Triplophysa tibetana TaxID=1572043 RepID=A0A5A9PTR3_9TELE|nr:hypothetical protein E1301_Tti005920 [Triplophysa tibetana]